MSNLSVKSRSYPIPLGEGTVTVTYQGDPLTYVDRGSFRNRGTQVTASEGHPFKSRDKHDLKDIGGEFETTRSYVVANSDKQRIDFTQALKQDAHSVQSAVYEGPLHAHDATSQGSYPVSAASPRGELDEAGATAIARCKPTNSVADAATFLGELRRDGLPSIPGINTWKDRTASARNAGSEYLNVQFGWQPTIADMKKFAYSVSRAHTVLEQYERDSGRTVRRRYNLPVLKSSETHDLEGYWWPKHVPYNSRIDQTLGYGTKTLTSETVKNRWFSGAFTYHLPAGNDYRSKMVRYALEADKLFGIAPTPDAVWNLAPWSWAIDWFSNTGDVISNLSDWATDGLVMRYGYMMEHSISKYTYSLGHTTGSVWRRGVDSSDVTFVTETKKRIRANPFGFGLTWEGLSPFQVSIAAALGISRS
jgi:hypothetical protein